jgi:hypothetical protein
VPLASITFSDDKMLSLTNMSELLGLFGHGNRALKQVHPEEEGEKRIAHLDFF